MGFNLVAQEYCSVYISQNCVLMCSRFSWWQRISDSGMQLPGAWWCGWVWESCSSRDWWCLVQHWHCCVRFWDQHSCTRVISCVSTVLRWIQFTGGNFYHLSCGKCCVLTGVSCVSCGKFYVLTCISYYARQQNASRILAIVKVSVHPSVLHTAVLCQTDTGYDHKIFTVGC